MTLKQKIQYLEENHFSEWLSTRKVVDEEMSNKQPMWCVCRKLATGLHELSCGKFRAKVNSATVTKLKHLLPRKETNAEPRQ